MAEHKTLAQEMEDIFDRLKGAGQVGLSAVSHLPAAGRHLGRPGASPGVSGAGGADPQVVGDQEN